MYLFGPEYTAEFKTGTRREWIITNGLGGYASSTLIGANTRTYHGLLVAALHPPVKRMLMLSSIDEEIISGDTVLHFASHRYQGALYPEGFRFIRKFQIGPSVKTTFEAHGITLVKEVFMAHGQNTTIIQYEISNPASACTMRLYPLVNLRSIHTTTRSHNRKFRHIPFDSGIMITGESDREMPPLFLHASKGRFIEAGTWYYNFEYDMERARGQPYLEDNYNPGYFSLGIGTGITRFSIVASTEPLDVYGTETLRTAEFERWRSLMTHPTITDDFARILVQASDSFLVHRDSTNAASVIAGYHWFSDWGRDAMISLPGLTLVTGRFEAARQIFQTFAHFCRDGLLPNRFPDSGEEADYNNVDASLWYVHALYKYLEYTQDEDFIRGLWSTLEGIVAHYRDGTGFGIHMDDDGLIRSDGQLTWMDAMAGDTMFTPRAGKACEINALWYNALRIMEHLAVRFGRDGAEYARLAMRCSRGYAGFWNQDAGCLYDVIDDNGVKDSAVRPNQIIAVSLPFSILAPDKEKQIVTVVQKELLTPFGLRTLSKQHPHYRGRCDGDALTRDRAYHQGTVWPWLMGPFVTAYCRVNNHSPESLRFAHDLFKPFEAHLRDGGIGTISEIFDGDFPHEPRGCISQAWSVAEVLRSYVEEILVHNDLLKCVE